MSTGIIFAWPSSTTNLFRSGNTPLYRVMSGTEIGLLGSLSSAGALASTPVLAILIDRLGRKNCSLVCALMNVIGWALISVSRQVEVIMTGLFIAGLGGGAFLIVAVFVGEFCQESIRGAMSSGSMVMYGVGILLAYLTGGLLDYWTNVYVSLGLTIVNLGLLCWLKESPIYLLMKGLEKEAAISIAFYRRVKTSTKEVADELGKLRRAINAEEDEIAPEEAKLQPKPERHEKLNLLQFVKKSRSTRRALLVTIILMTASIFQGLVVVQVYAEPLFEKTVPDMPTTVATVIFAVINVLSGFCAAYLTEICGRKPLIIYPSIGASICCFLCGLQLCTSFGPNWLMPLFIYVFATCFAFGAATVPFVLLAEVFLPEVKSYMTMIIVEWTWLCNFLVLFVFDPLMNAIGLGPVFFIFSATCLLTAIFSIFFVPETKGVPLDEIQRLMVPKKHRLNNI
ncbi:facilitated trehalose transporter Tret1-like isoform X2 [Plodia interpunctella]|nr:facilitated trehalose transporter Tret1-like isoform X2 [Plodia interpunctella]